MNANKIFIGVLGAALVGALGVIWQMHGVSSDRARTIAQLRSAVANLTSQVHDLARDAKSKKTLVAPPAGSATGEANSGITKPEEAQLIARHEASKAKNAARILEQTIAAPEMQEAYFWQMKSALPVAYANLYHRLSLSPEQIRQFESILANRFQTVSDVELAARANGLTRNDAAYMKLYSEVIRPTEDQLVELLGDAGYRQYMLHEQRVPVQSLVESLSGKAAGIASPLSSEQMGLLSEILLANSNAEMGASGDWVRDSIGGRSASTVGPADIDWGTAMSQLATVLPEKQFKLLEGIAKEATAKKSASELNRQIRVQAIRTGSK